MMESHFEFLLMAPDDIEIRNEDFDRIMTPDSMEWEKIHKNSWVYYQVGNDEFSYSFEMPGIQMTFNDDISFDKAKQIADEVATKLSGYTGWEVTANLISGDKPIKF